MGEQHQGQALQLGVETELLVPTSFGLGRRRLGRPIERQQRCHAAATAGSKRSPGQGD